MANTSAARDFGRRLKAALALRGWGIAELASAIPAEYRLSKSTLDRIASGARAPNDWEIPALASALEVPEEFLRRGLEAMAERPAASEASERTDAAIETLRRDLLERIDRLERDLRSGGRSP